VLVQVLPLLLLLPPLLVLLLEDISRDKACKRICTNKEECM
jgi:hypothetical protein